MHSLTHHFLNRFKRFWIVVGIVIHLLSVSVWAQVTPESWEVGPFVGRYWFDDDQNLEDKLTVGLRLGYAFTPHFTLEGSLDFPHVPSKPPPGHVDTVLQHIDALYHFQPDTQVVPFIAGGIGRLGMEGYGPAFMANVGAGVKYFLTKKIVLRGDVRYISAFVKNNAISRVDNVEATLGVGYVWQRQAERVPPPPPPAPVPAPKLTPVPPADSDGDGVIDLSDLCPRTPAGVAVAKNGCPSDSDGDGVLDAADQCPDTPHGSAVDSKGCPPSQPPVAKEPVTITLNVQFDTNKAVIKPQSESEIQKFADFMREHPAVTVEIGGHTDNIGSENDNMVLSRTRAGSVSQELIGLGVNAARLTAKGYGPTQPVADNATEGGRKENRRVTATITAEK